MARKNVTHTPKGFDASYDDVTMERVKVNVMSKRTSSRTQKTATTDQEMAELGKKDFKAVLTNEQVREYESTQNEMWGTKRRVAMIALARSKEQLVDGFSEGDSPDTLLDMIGHINEWRDHIKSQIEMADMASARLMAVASAIIYRNREFQGASA